MTILDDIGGESVLMRLVERFYDIIETHPLGRDILILHQNGHGVRHSRVEQFNYLSGFLGGRKYYLEKHRHINVKQMHDHVPIRLIDAENWLKCMDIAIEESGIAQEYHHKMRLVFERVATLLVNQTD